MDLIPIRERTTIPGSPEEIWPLLADPMSVVRCIPGATLAAQRPDGVYPASITVKFGPTVANFSGEVKVTYDLSARECTVEGRGIDDRGASSALVTATVTLDGKDPTVLAVEGGFNVTGPLETFANAGGVHVARALLAEFAGNMGRLIQGDRATGTDKPQSSELANAKPMNGGTILWRAFRSWLRQLFTLNKQA